MTVVKTRMAAGFHVCIVGAGIVGLAGGILLRRHGFKVTILERDSVLQTIGAGIQLHPNAGRVLQDLGVYERVRAKSASPRSIVLKSYKDGQTLHKQDLLRLSWTYGSSLLTVHRAHLRQVLYEEAIAQGVDIRLGIAIAPNGIDFENGVLRLANPAGTFEADLFIGADGANSIFREALAGHRTRMVPEGRVVNRILVDEKVLLEKPRLRELVTEGGVVVWLGPECQAVTYSLDGIFNIAFTWPWPSDPKDVFFGPQPVDLKEFRSKLDSWEPDLRDLIELGKDGLRWMLFVRHEDEDKTPWVDSRAKFCIVGDAAHQVLPYLAQGAAIGLESVSVLAHLLSECESKDRVPECLEIYESMQRQRTDLIIRASLKNGRLWQLPDGPVKDERDREFLHDVPGAGFPNLLADPFFQSWLWGFDAREAARDALLRRRSKRRV